MLSRLFCFFFFFNDTATTEIYTLSLHDALPISRLHHGLKTTPGNLTLRGDGIEFRSGAERFSHRWLYSDRKSTRLNSSHLVISYAVFCLKKKKKDRMRRHVKADAQCHLDVCSAY